MDILCARKSARLTQSIGAGRAAAHRGERPTQMVWLQLDKKADAPPQCLQLATVSGPTLCQLLRRRGRC